MEAWGKGKLGLKEKEFQSFCQNAMKTSYEPKSVYLRESEQAENSLEVSGISLHTVRKSLSFSFFFLVFIIKSWPAVKCNCWFEIISVLRLILHH